MEEKIHTLELTAQAHTLKMEEMWRRFDKFEDKIDKLPNEDRIIVLFAKEGEKLATGLIKKDEEQQKQLNDLKTEVASNNKAMRWVWSGVVVLGGLVSFKIKNLF